MALDDNSAKFQPEVQRAVEIMREQMLADPGPIAPHLMAFPPELPGVSYINAFGKYAGSAFLTALDVNLMAHWQTKNMIGSLIVKLCFTARSKVTVFLSDALGARPAPGKTFDDYPRNFSEWPRSLIQEALLVSVNAAGMKGYGLTYGYTRDGKNRRVFDTAEPNCELDNGRFCFDLTDATEESATLDALNRNCNGKLEASA